MAQTLGSLLIELKAETAHFAAGLDKARKLTLDTTTQIERSAKYMTGVVAAGAVAAGTALLAMAEHSIMAADAMNKASQKTGVSVESLSGLKYAAELADVEFGELQKGLEKFSRAIVKGAAEINDQGKAWGALGVSVRDAQGQIRPTEQILLDVAEKFRTTENGAKKTAVAMELFGKSGANMIPFLNAGRQGIAAMLKEAERLGVVLSTDTARQAEEFQDNLKRLQTGAQGFGNAIAREVLPTLLGLSNALVEGQKEMNFGADVAQQFALGLRLVGTAGVGLVSILKSISIGVRDTFATVISLVRGDFDAMHEIGEKNAKDETALWAGTWGQIDEIWGNGVARLKVKTSDFTQHLETEGKKQKDALLDSIIALKQSVLETGLTGDALELFKLQIKGADNATLDYVRQLQGLRDMLKAVRTEVQTVPIVSWERKLAEETILLNAAKDKFAKLAEGAAIKPIFASPDAEPAGSDITKFDEEQRGRARIFLDSIKQMRDGTKEFKKDLTDMAHTIGTALEDSIVKFKGFADVFKGLMEDIMRVFIRATITRPLTNWLLSTFGSLGSAFGGGGAGGSVANLAGLPWRAPDWSFLTPRASGGPVMAGMGYLVGERGPEPFIPSSNGSIVPNAGMQVVINNNIDARGAGPGVFNEISAGLKASEDRAVRRAVATVREINLRRP